MATPKLDLDGISAESAQILELIKDKKNFLLSGGAGSGKTYSLIEVLKAVINDSPSLNIGCITYTNAAVNEIEDRISHDNLYVSTIVGACFIWHLPNIIQPSNL